MKNILETNSPSLKPLRPRVRGLAAMALCVLAALLVLQTTPARAAERLEKTDLKFGFIKLTDCVPIIIAKEMNYFEDEGLYVTVEAQSNWKILLDLVISGELDGAHMLAGQPIAATIGFGTKAHVITAFSMDLNGNGITLGNAIWEQRKTLNPSMTNDPIERPLNADLLKPVVQKLRAEGTPMKMGTVFPVSTHNYELRYWLASGGISPGYYTSTDATGTKDADVLISVTPPPQMPATLAQGTIQGYCVGEPWNSAAIAERAGVCIATSSTLDPGHPEKVLMVRERFAEQQREEHLALVAAILQAAEWCAVEENHEELIATLARPEFVGVATEILRPGVRNFCIFSGSGVNEPSGEKAAWTLELIRQSELSAPTTTLNIAVARRAFRSEIFSQSISLLPVTAYS